MQNCKKPEIIKKHIIIKPVFYSNIMDEKTRITKDIIMFEDNIKKINTKDLQNNIVELAKQYYEDSKYYLEKKDYFTAFGCINYAHGLLDALIKF